MKMGEVGLGSIELCAIAAEGISTHKHCTGSPAMPFEHECTTTPVNKQSHARQGVPRIWAVARFGEHYLNNKLLNNELLNKIIVQ